MNRRGLSRALAVIGVLSSVAAAVPATASAATASPARSATLSRPALTAAAASAASAGPGLSQTAGWAAAARQAAASGRLTLPSLVVASAATTAGARPTSALSAITGVIRGADGVALTGACVTASGRGGTVSVAAGAGGRYVLAGLRPGAYTVSYQDCARPARYFEQWSGGTDLAANAARVLVRAGRPARLAPVTLRLTSPAAETAAVRTGARRAGPATSGGDTISGVARSRSGHPLAGICVSASMSSRNSAEAVGGLTGPHGGYALGIGSSGSWQVEFTGGCGGRANYAPQWWRYAATPRKSTYLHARPGRRFRGINASLRPGASISGVARARRSGQPLSHICVVASGLGQMQDIQVEASTRPDGSYLIKNLGTGRYHVRFDAYCDQTGNYLSADRRRPVAVTDGKTTTGINGELAQGGSISGVVTSHASGAPLAGVCVGMTKGSSDFGAVTSRAGEYSFRHLNPGRYSVGFTAGCGSRGSYAPQSYDGQPNAEGATPITVEDGQARTGIDAAMLPGATVTGRATGRAGAGLRGVCVLLISRNYAGGLGDSFVADLDLDLLDNTVSPPVTVTGRGGRYRLANLVPGQYAAEFITGCGGGTARYGSQVFAPQGHGGDWVSAGAGTVTAGVGVALRPAASITGTVTGSRSRRLSGICVLAIDRATEGPLSITPLAGISRRGVYRIGGLAAGRYKVVFLPCGHPLYADQWYRRRSSEAAATPVPVRTGRVTRDINAALVRGGTLNGRIVAARTGRPAARICVFVGSPVSGTAVPVLEPGVAVGLTGPSGRYRIPDVPPGRWDVTAAPCLAPSRLAGIVYHGVPVRNGVTHTVATIRLPRAGGLAGTVLGGSPAKAEPGICVEATPAGGDGVTGTGVTGLGGRYTLTGLAPGRYRVLFTPDCALGTAAVTATATSARVVASRITAGVGARLAADGGISGTVSTGASAVVGVCVGAFAAGRPAPTALAITAAGGRYELDGLAAGRYQVEFTAGCGDTRYAARWYQGATTRRGARPVTVTAGSVTTGIDQG